MYIEQKIEQLEREIEELKEQKKSEQYLTPAQFAEKMHCSKGFVTKMIREGEIQALKMGRLVRIPMSQFEEKKGETEKTWKDIVFEGV